MKENPEFLDLKYKDLTGSKPVERAVQKAKQDQERVFFPHTRDERIQAYLDRIDHIVEDARGWELLKSKIIKEFSIDINDEEILLKIANTLYESEKRIAVEQGREFDVEKISDDPKVLDSYKELVLEKQGIQSRTIEAWLDYLQQNDAHYPTWFRYFVVRNLEKMGSLDKEKGEYTKRTRYTVAPFPELNSEALGFVYRVLTTGVGHQEFVEEQDKRDKLIRLVEKKDFIKLYTFAQIETAGALNRESLQGEWVKFEKGSDHKVLEDTLRGKGTGWCTAEGSAYSQIRAGDFYVFYTKGSGGKYSEPRIAIRMEDDRVIEVRGVGQRQELEPALVDIAREKYSVLPGGDKFEKKSGDMKRVTALVKKNENGETFSKEDLRFIYEIDSKIEGFGYGHDSRIEELLRTRDKRTDIASIFDISKDKISLTTEEALRGGILYHFGYLYLDGLTSAEGLQLPQSIGGDLYLSGLTSAEGLQLPQSIGGDLRMSGLTSAEGLQLPQSIGGDLYLGVLTSAEGLQLPQSVGGKVFLYRLPQNEITVLRSKHPNLNIIC